MASPVKMFTQVIEISSDEEPSPQAPAVLKSRSVRYVHAHKPISVSSSDSELETEAMASTSYNSSLHSPVKASHKLDVIDLTVSSSEDEYNTGEEDGLLDKAHSDSDLNTLKQLSLGGTESEPKTNVRNVQTRQTFPSSILEQQDPWDTNDGSILTWYMSC
jgi:hypothetical protein